MGSLLDPFYRAVESGDPGIVERWLLPDAFVLTPEADGVLLSREDVVRSLGDRLRLVAALPGGVHLEAEPMASGESADGLAAWVFDVVSVWIGDPAEALPVRVRVTALLTRDAQEWRVAACSWSLPYATQADQDAVKHAGLLEPGTPLPETDESPPYVAGLEQALADPSLLPGLYSAGEDHATIGSVVDEVFLGSAGRAAWEEFVTFVSSFVVRGPLRGALVTQDVGWLAANIDIGQPPTPYRFFYVWRREAAGWRVVISHDGVSRPLDMASFR